MRIRKAGKHMQTSMQGIASKAKRDAKYRFGNLYSLLNKENLKWSFKQLNRKASPGTDGIDYQKYAAELDGNITELAETIRNKKYKAKLVKRKYIPKAGGRRPLGIPVIADKTVQTAAAEILEAIYEQEFYQFSHGYRREHSPRKAALELRLSIQKGRYGWIVDADIKSFFDKIDHEWMIKMLEQRVEDKSYLRLIRKWLKAGILEEDGKVINPTTGTPQGGVISAVLANIYLHYVIDMWFAKVIKQKCRGDASIIRYADDSVCCFQYLEDAKMYLEALRKRLEKFKLQLSEEKTKMIRFSRFQTKDNETFKFLGFEYRWGESRKGNPVVRMKTAKKKIKAAIEAITEWIKDNRSNRIKEIMATYKLKMQGHMNYYGVGCNYERLDKYYSEANRIVYKWLNRRSQRKSYNWEEFRKLLEDYAIPKPRIIAW